MEDSYLIGCALFAALLITRKNAPFNLAKKLRETGYTALNCTLCAFGWTLILLFSMGQISALAAALDPFVRLGALLGYGWAIVALIGLASWDN